VNREPAQGSVWATAVAEFLKIQASRFPLVILAALPAGVFLFVFELYHVEGMAQHVGPDPLRQFAVLCFTAWKTLLFQAAIVAFAAYWTTVDSQYGMIRVAACQPLTRVQYLLGKWLGIAAHVVLLTMAYILTMLMWTTLYAGWQGVDGAAAIAIVRFGVQTIVFATALTLITTATASLRTTVSAGMITALLTLILLSFAMMLPFDVMSPRFVFMRYFLFPLGELPNPFPTESDSPFVRVLPTIDFYRTTAVTVMCFVAPAIWSFRRRDIQE